MISLPAFLAVYRAIELDHACGVVCPRHLCHGRACLGSRRGGLTQEDREATTTQWSPSRGGGSTVMNFGHQGLHPMYTLPYVLKPPPPFWCGRMGSSSSRGIHTQRILIDNGGLFRSRTWADACADVGVGHRFTRPYRPQTNGKGERFSARSVTSACMHTTSL
jgi:hypothetical protein